jgi:hypothetical protein
MAQVGRPINKFYVYAIKNEEGSIVYIGKGSGRRFEVQKKNFELSGEILETFASEKLAYAKEVEFISLHKPSLNKCKGGNGCTATNKRIVKQDYEKLIERIGSRACAARLLLSYNKVNPKMIDQSKVDLFREVAYG